MGCEPDQWARDWLALRRAEGQTGLTVEKKGQVHYLKWATTKWDPELKKRHKISEYRGVLNPDGTVTPPRPRRPRVEVADLKDSGNARVLAWAIEPILPALKEAFPRDHPELVELAFTRCLGRGELVKAGRCWNRLEDVLGLRPNISPTSLSRALADVGRSRGSQDLFFDRIRTADRNIAIDMSVLFSRARGATLVKSGYNRFRTSNTQVNLLLVCGLATGLPQYMRAVPGNGRESNAVSMLDEFDVPEGTVLVMDRGYCDRKFLSAVTERGLEYVVAAKRNSKAYEEVQVDERSLFRWRGSVVAYGHGPFRDGQAYRFENLNQRNDELVDALRARERGSERTPDLDKAGNFMLLTSMPMDPENVYGTYKKRCEIENRFDEAKNCLSADRMHMNDDEHILGHMFVTFLALSIWSAIADLIDRAGMSTSCTVSDVLDTYAAMKVMTSNAEVRQVVPKDIRDLDQGLGLHLYTERNVPKRRGRRPKASASS
mgnify:CR=1 FL=1